MSEVERTDDGRYIVVGGRRWRATDPNIPEPFRKELVSELMSARRAVKAARSDENAMARARTRVHQAKIALGERGDPWWEPATDEGGAARARAAVLAMLSKRGERSSICPSDVARIVASPDWRPSMDAVRSVASDMADEGLIVMTQGDRTVEDLADVRGPVRLRLPDGGGGG